MSTGRIARQRLVAKAAIGAALVLLGLLAPVETNLPGSLQDRLGSTEAAAQPSTVQIGLPDACPAGYTAVADLCRVEQPACPYSPLDPTRMMQRSSEFTEFCEETVTLAAKPAEYAVCAAPLQGYVVMDDGTSCRVLQLRTCEVGSRIDSEWCRSTIRRSWTCPQPYAIPRNQFNTCYIVPTSAISLTVTCGPGAPDLVVIDCADYVGNDVVVPPGSVLCGSYFTGRAPTMADVVANAYWCEFDQSYLKIACHGAAPPPGECGPSLAMCLKRGSGTGGCDGIAHTMLCRSWQFDYEQQHATALADNMIDRTEESSLRTLSIVVRADGCEPCLILPFQPLPSHCPADTRETASPVSFPRTSQFQAIEQEHDIETNHTACAHLNTWQQTTMANPNNPSLDCAAIASRCDSPSPGNPVWSSTHFSGLAVVNSSVIVQLHDSPFTFREYPRSFSLNTLISGNFRWGGEYPEFPGSGLAPSGQIVRTFSRPPSSLITNSPADVGNLSNECVTTALTLFKLIVEELWPDRPADAAAITAMFGSRALDWWTNLGATPGAQQRLTEARGLRWWPGLTTPAEQDERIASLKTKVDCHSGQSVVVWCRWTPTRSGYFRLKVGGGWRMSIGDIRGSIGAARLQALSRSVQSLTPQQQQQVRDTLAVIGCGSNRAPDSSCAWSPAAVGLQNDLSDIIPFTPDSLYRSPTEGQMYPGLDLRVRYSDQGETAKYTETQSFGIQVHEVRVSTVTPSR